MVTTEGVLGCDATETVEREAGLGADSGDSGSGWTYNALNGSESSRRCFDDGGGGCSAGADIAVGELPSEGVFTLFVLRAGGGHTSSWKMLPVSEAGNSDCAGLEFSRP